MRIHRVVLVTVALASLLPFTASPSTASTDGPRTGRVIGTWDRITPTALATWGEAAVVPPGFFLAPGKRPFTAAGPIATTGTLVGNLARRQMWQLYVLDKSRKDPRSDSFIVQAMGVVVFDVDSRHVIRTFELPVLDRATTQDSYSADWLHAIDSDGGRMFFLTGSHEILEVDTRTFRVRQLPFAEPHTVNGRRLNVLFVRGLAFDEGIAPGPEDDAIIGFGGFNGIQLVDVTGIVRVPLNGTRSTFRPIHACNGTPTNVDINFHLGVPMLLTRERFYVPCHRSGFTVLVVALERTTALEPTGPEVEVAGPTYMETGMADPVSGRLFIVTTLGELWVFEAASMSFVGVIATETGPSPQKAGYGIDPVTGRVLFQSTAFGFGVVEGRFFPVPQAIVAPGTKAEGGERILSDARTRLAYVLEGGEGLRRATAYKMYDIGEAPAPPARPDPDRSTADIDEVPGRTESNYFASASGYGVRVLAVKGLSTVPPAAGAGQITTGQVVNDYVNSKCGYTDRELLAGAVGKAEYSTGAAAATADALEVDERTKLDLERASRCDATVRDNTGMERFSGIFATAPQAVAADADGGPGWGRRPAACTSSAGEGATTGAGTQDPGRPPLGDSRVDCPEPGGLLVATATAALAGGVTVGRADTRVRIERTARGVESVVTSVAEDIAVGEILRIGSIEAEARSVANGRPRREPMSSHTVRMTGVRVAGEEVCGATCDPTFVVERLRAFNLGRVEFRTVMGRDEHLLRGSPKGAQTAVQKSAARQASDRGLLGDTRSELPAFEMIVYNDNTEYGRARQVYQFAGVAGAANYNIVPLPSFADLLGGDDDGPSRPDGLSLDAEPVATVDDGALLSTASASAGREPGGGGLMATVRRAVRAVGEGLALIVTDPRRAFLVLTAWAVIVAPAALSRRRRLLLRTRT